VAVLVDRTVRRFVLTPPVANRDIDFTFELARPAFVRLDVARAGKTIAPVYSGSLPAGAQTVGWSVAGTKDGKYAGVLTTAGEVGSATRTMLFRIDTKPPQLRAVSFRTLRFWVSEAATIRLVVNGKRVVQKVRAGAFAFRHGRVRSVRIYAQDAAGNLSPTLRFR
jgi:hypothetical protein